ncbi:hypothetical protein CDL15_Pgr009346 [Punica granatum]|uniref:Uncharacterized protein n=1 Tax=Punica granatum TaxID=22663 RepID=A0A218XHD6_PUNGR|nr:hypothetical protein CDL15_Pgr009346 [Punica granatum]
MATAGYLAEIKSKMGIDPRVEQNDAMKMLHIKASLGDWREWMVLTFNHNILGDMLLKENQELKKKIEELEKSRFPVAIPSFPFPSY